MGLDIIQVFDIEDLDEDLSLYDKSRIENHYELSRTFCYFFRQTHYFRAGPSLEQIGKLLRLDLSPLIEIPQIYNDNAKFDWITNPKEYLKKTVDQKNQILGNLQELIWSLNGLISKLEKDKKLRIKVGGLGQGKTFTRYFENLDTTEIVNYIDNNLTQDLRNLLRYSELAKSKGALNTYFHIG